MFTRGYLDQLFKESGSKNPPDPKWDPKGKSLTFVGSEVEVSKSKGVTGRDGSVRMRLLRVGSEIRRSTHQLRDR